MSKEFRIGLLALISGAILYFGFNYLKGIDFFSKSSYYYVIYDQVDGLTRSNSVIINGLAVGKVNDIRLLQSEQNQILVELMISSDIALGDSAVAELKDTDILGGKSIVLKPGDISNPREPGDTLIAYVDRGLAEYLDNVTPLTNNLEITISRVNEILLGLKGSGEKVNVTISELNRTLSQVNEILENNKYEWGETLKASRQLVENIDSKVSRLDPVLDKTELVLDSLGGVEINETLRGMNALMGQISEVVRAVDNGQGSLGKLVNNDSLYNNLNQVLIDLDRLLIHLDQYPKDFMAPLGRKREKMEGGKKDL